MKKNIYLIWVLIAAALSACQESILNLTPESALTDVDFYKTASDMEAAVLGVYSSLKNRRPNDYLVLELPSDNLYRSGYTAAAGANEVDNLAFTSENPLFASFWEDTYAGIFRANAVLANIDKPTNYGVGQKEKLVAEARFMRALFYFDLVRMFGGVPKVERPISAIEAESIVRATEEEIYSLMIEDLVEAVADLPERKDASSGRASKGAAAALLGKIYVYRGEWAKAKMYLDLTSSYGYQLEANFASLWKLETENNREVIFSMKYVDGTDGQTLSTDFLPYNGVIGVSSRGNESSFPAWGLQKLYLKTDQRAAATISSFWKNPSTPDSPAVWYPFVSKFAVPHTPASSGLDLPVLRFADIVLLKAEVLYALSQPEQALAELNRVRERAFDGASNNYSMSDIATKDAFLDKLFLERRLEFAFENERWFDLTRSGRFMKELIEEERYYNNDTHSSLKFALNPKAYQKHFPIPQSQIQLYPSQVLSQNEGYN